MKDVLLKESKVYLKGMRCTNCEKLLAKIRGTAEIKCTRCGTYNIMTNK
ncbi:Com family DNA-binding transcriptional regulator [Planococcus sp. ISL-110]|nr:Com family DNA-binding transcriptional regulator [Planococcus sp. ISL-110]